MALFVQVGNYVKVRTTPLPETANQEDYERIHISEFSATTKGSSTLAFMDGDRTVLVMSGDADAQSYYGNTMSVLIAAVDTFISTLEETGSGGLGTQEQANWTESNNLLPAFIKNKPTLATVATTGAYNDLGGKPSIPAAQIQSDWTQGSSGAADFIKNKPTIPDVSGLLPKSGADAGAQSQPQEFTNGTKTVYTSGAGPTLVTITIEIVAGGYVHITKTDASDGSSVTAILNNDGTVSAIDNTNSTYSKLLSSGKVTSHKSGVYADSLTLAEKTISTSDSPYTVVAADQTIFANNTEGNITIVIPEPSLNDGRELIIKKVDANVGDVGFSETIDGNDSFVLNTQYQSITIKSAGSKWYITSSHLI